MGRARARIDQAAVRLTAAWRRLRPPSRRQAIGLLGAAAACTLVLYLGAASVSRLAAGYGFHPDVGTAAWRALTPAFGESTTCGSCHAPQQARLASTRHAAIGCQSCHGPLAAHALTATAAPGTVPGTAAPAAAPMLPATSESTAADVDATVPTDALCVTCHTQAIGRPADFRQIEPADHYVPACLQCHDPHTGISRRPPVVEHTLERLPPCVTCHGPDGFKARNQRHPVTADEDRECLACHLEDRGPTAARWTWP